MAPAPFALPLLVVGPPTLQRAGLLRTLADHLPDRLVSVTADPDAAVPRLAHQRHALLILDTALVGPQLDTLLGQVRTQCPGQRVLVLGGKRLPFGVGRLLVEMGGGVLLARRATPEDVVAAVIRLLGGTAGAPPLPLRPSSEPLRPYARRHPEAELLTLLSPRELDVLRLVAADFPNHEIAVQLGISVRTVESHRRILLEKTGARSMVGLILRAVRHGWLQVV